MVVDHIRVGADGDGLVVGRLGGLEEADHAVDLELLVAVVHRVGGVDEVIEILAGRLQGTVDDVLDPPLLNELPVHQEGHHGVGVPAIAADGEVEVRLDEVDARLLVGHIGSEPHRRVRDGEEGEAVP